MVIGQILLMDTPCEINSLYLCVFSAFQTHAQQNSRTDAIRTPRNKLSSRKRTSKEGGELQGSQRSGRRGTAEGRDAQESGRKRPSEKRGRPPTGRWSTLDQELSPYENKKEQSFSGLPYAKQWMARQVCEKFLLRILPDTKIFVTCHSQI
jgi:hypothetical protein